MPNMDGTGPRWCGCNPGYGFGRGRGMYARGGYGPGPGLGLGVCRWAGLDSREALEAQKAYLAQRLFLDA